MNFDHEVNVGDKVRSHDFPHREPEEGHECYVEGIVEAILPRGETRLFEIDGMMEEVSFPDCDRVVIDITGRMWDGEWQDASELEYNYVFPPVNGVPTFSGVTRGIELIEEYNFLTT